MPVTANKILVVNAGSSSVKLSVFGFTAGSYKSESLRELWHDEDQFPHDTADPAVKDKIDAAVQAFLLGPNPLLQSKEQIAVIGHRVVHGGDHFSAPTLISTAVKKEISRLSEFAPIHNPINLSGIEATAELFPRVPQVAVFDTSFYRFLPKPAANYPLPFDWIEKYGIKRYGFHGISHQYAAQKAAELLKRDPNDLNLITCHLGSGCSLTAISNGRSIDTTMGFTPLDGLMMGSRSGSIDPGIIFYLNRSGMTFQQIEYCLNYESGLKGISGISNDLREIYRSAASGNKRAELADAMFKYRLQSYVGTLLVHLLRLDAVVFTGGIGENVPSIRQAACDALRHIGAQIDSQLNVRNQPDSDFSAPESTVKLLLIKSRENLAIAQQCLLLQSSLE